MKKVCRRVLQVDEGLEDGGGLKDGEVGVVVEAKVVITKLALGFLVAGQPLAVYMAANFQTEPAGRRRRPAEGRLVSLGIVLRVVVCET